jgi:ketosteroid isomerase-like protein
MTSLSEGTFHVEAFDILADDEHGVVLATEADQRDGKTLENRAVHVWEM